MRIGNKRKNRDEKKRPDKLFHKESLCPVTVSHSLSITTSVLSYHCLTASTQLELAKLFNDVILFTFTQLALKP